MFVTFSNFKGTFLISDSSSSLEVNRSCLLDMRKPLGISGDYQGKEERVRWAFGTFNYNLNGMAIFVFQAGEMGHISCTITYQGVLISLIQ